MKNTFLAAIIILVLVSASAADVTIANDPSYIAVGARTLGMGKAYTGVADDLMGIFINPSALASLSRWQASTMASRFINEFNYYNSAWAIPLRQGTLGLGFVGSGISFYSVSATQEVRDGVRYVPSTTEGSSYTYGNNMLLLSYGTKLKDLTPWRWLDDLSVGTTWKLYFASLAGPGISGGTANGNEVDLGIHYLPDDRPFKAGLALQNALPFSMGGKLAWASGAEEAMPAILKTGLSFRILGKKGWRQAEEHELSYNLDIDYYPNDSRLPTLVHQGIEWTPSPLIDIRAGLDQDYVGLEESGGISAVSNPTFGVGLFYKGFRFDYAYHQYNIAANDTHYFSITYGIDRLIEEPQPVFANLFPADKTILFAQEIAATGEALKKEIELVRVDTIEAILLDRIFMLDLTLSFGKNKVSYSGFDGEGKLVGSQLARVLSLKGFGDVSPEYWASVPIGFLAMEGIISGYPDGTFRPEGEITRAEFTKLLMSAKGIGDFVPEGKPYQDIKIDHWAANYIGFGARYGYVKGYPDGTFRPNNPVTRAEGVTMISRYANLPEIKNPVMPFDDVPGRYWAANEIIKTYESGILEYLKDKPFEPKRPLTRAEVAEMLARTPGMKEKLNDLLDWSSY